MNGKGLVLLGSAAALAWAVRDHLTTPFDPQFESSGTRYDVPPNLLRAIARRESSFRVDARGPTSDYGIMQVNILTLKRFGLTPDDVLSNAQAGIDAGARYLQELQTELGNRFSSFTWPMAYNVGPDLSPHDVGVSYAQAVYWHWVLYDIGRSLAPPASKFGGSGQSSGGGGGSLT